MKPRTAIIALALLFAWALVPSSVSNVDGVARADSGQDALRINREFRAAPGQKLEFDLDTGGRIEIIGWDNPSISVEAYKGGRDGALCEINFHKTSAGLRITSEYKGPGQSYSSDLSFFVRVPKRFDLEFDSMGGSIHICDVEGRISGKTMGGGLTLNNLGGDLNLQTMGGGITLTNSEVHGSVETMGGKVLIENVLGDVRGSTMGGNVVRRNTSAHPGRTAATECAPTRRREV